MKTLSNVGCLAVALIVSQFAFGAEGSAAPDPAKAQTIATQMCAACHGADGNSLLPANPSLAGQHADYVTKQLRNYKAGERNNPIMMGMVAALTPDDMKNLGAYFETKAPKLRAARDETLAKLGERLYRGGKASAGMPACAGCHGPTGAGVPAQFPRLAGQYSEYIAQQLKSFRAGERANDPNRMMRMVADQLSDQEIQALAEYVSGLR